MAVKVMKRAAEIGAAKLVAPAAKPARKTAAAGSLAEAVSEGAEPVAAGIFAVLEKARANMREGDANLARARKILG